MQLHSSCNPLKLKSLSEPDLYRSYLCSFFFYAHYEARRDSRERVGVTESKFGTLPGKVGRVC